MHKLDLNICNAALQYQRKFKKQRVASSRGWQDLAGLDENGESGCLSAWRLLVGLFEEIDLESVLTFFSGPSS